jgi:hypothetical protein
MPRDNVSSIQVQSGLDALPAKKTTFTSATIDRMKSDGGYEALTLYLLAGTWTDGSFAFAINDSPDNSTFTAVGTSAPDNLIPDAITGFASITSALTAVNQKVGYVGSKRYVQVVCTVTGSPATGCTMDILGVLGHSRNVPTTA